MDAPAVPPAFSKEQVADELKAVDLVIAHLQGIKDPMVEQVLAAKQAERASLAQQLQDAQTQLDERTAVQRPARPLLPVCSFESNTLNKKNEQTMGLSTVSSLLPICAAVHLADSHTCRKKSTLLTVHLLGCQVIPPQ